MRMTEPHQFVGTAFDGLSALVRNLLLDNKNFQSGHYCREYPRTDQFVRHVLTVYAEAILDRIDEVRSLAVNMAAPDEPANENKARGTARKVSVRVKARAAGIQEPDEIRERELA
jgi:hypothetical protein